MKVGDIVQIVNIPQAKGPGGSRRKTLQPLPFLVLRGRIVEIGLMYIPSGKSMEMLKIDMLDDKGEQTGHLMSVPSASVRVVNALDLLSEV